MFNPQFMLLLVFNASKQHKPVERTAYYVDYKREIAEEYIIHIFSLHLHLVPLPLYDYQAYADEHDYDYDVDGYNNIAIVIKARKT